MSDDKSLQQRMDDKAKLTTSNGKIKFGAGSALHQRMAANVEARKQADTLVGQLPNRIGLMLDGSGSMGYDKMSTAKQAGDAFLFNCDPQDTAVSLASFGQSPEVRIPLTVDHNKTNATIQSMQSCGGTPMHVAMEDTLKGEPITRGVLVSDGEADSPQKCIDLAHTYKEAGIPIDCVHIGDESSGEATLRKIASITGGYFIKFTNIENFAQNFKYLTPKYRALLAESNAAKLLGAREVL